MNGGYIYTQTPGYIKMGTGDENKERKKEIYKQINKLNKICKYVCQIKVMWCNQHADNMHRIN